MLHRFATRVRSFALANQKPESVALLIYIHFKHISNFTVAEANTYLRHTQTHSQSFHKAKNLCFYCSAHLSVRWRRGRVAG